MKGLRLTGADLDALLKRGHVRLVRGTASGHPVKPKVETVRPTPPASKDDPDRYSRALARQIRGASLPAPILEYPFDKQIEGGGRRWAFDLAWPSLMLAVEVDGAVHRIKERFKSDLEKRQAADRLGWRVLPVSPRQVESGRALELVRDALAGITDESAKV